MRIGLFFWSLELGGVEHMMVNLSREMVERGHEVTLVLARGPQPNEYTPDRRVKVVRLDCVGTGKAILKLSNHLRVAQYDVIYTAMPTTNVAAIAALRLSGAKTKIVISERSNPTLEAQHSKTWRYRAAFTLQPFVYPMANAIVAVCKDLADELAEFARLKRDSIRVIYNPAFDEKAANAPIGDTHPWLEQKTVPVVISAGRLMKQKDYGTLIRGFGELRKQRPAKLIILGEGPEREELKALVVELGLAEDVALPGFKSNIHAYLSKADVFALTSIWEGFGNVLVQALGARCSIVSTNCRNGPREILEDGQYGKLVDVGDAQGLARALGEVIDNPFDSERQYERAQFFTAARSAQAYESLFSSLLAKAS